MMEQKAINAILIYMISAFLNVMMQEILLRGYLSNFSEKTPLL